VCGFSRTVISDRKAEIFVAQGFGLAIAALKAPLQASQNRSSHENTKPLMIFVYS
jgi:hypothetical protein